METFDGNNPSSGRTDGKILTFRELTMFLRFLIHYLSGTVFHPTSKDRLSPHSRPRSKYRFTIIENNQILIHWVGGYTVSRVEFKDYDVITVTVSTFVLTWQGFLVMSFRIFRLNIRGQKKNLFGSVTHTVDTVKDHGYYTNILQCLLYGLS